MLDSLQLHGLQRVPSLSPRVCSNSCPLSRCCYLTISPSVTHFSFCLQSFPALEAFPMSLLFSSGGQSIFGQNFSGFQSWLHHSCVTLDKGSKILRHTFYSCKVLWSPDVKSWLIWKDPDARKDWGQEEKGMTQDEMVGWHHRLNEHEFG